MSDAASLIIKNARAMTMDPLNPAAEAVAVKGQRILFSGSNTDAGAFFSATTRVVDAQGCSLLPGFTDAHVHLVLAATEWGSVDLTAVRTVDQLEPVLKKFAAEHPEKAWIVGTQTRYISGPNGEPLNRQHLDAIVPDRPVALMSFTLHTLWSNTRGLELSGIFSNPGTGGEIGVVVGSDGLASGELREFAAMNPVMKLTDNYGFFVEMMEGRPFTSVHIQRALAETVKYAASYGITTVHNMDGNSAQLALFDALEARGELGLRLYFPLEVQPGTKPEALLEAVDMREKHKESLIRSGFLKFLSDGEVQSWTALLMFDYKGRPGFKGTANFDLENFNELVLEGDRLGLQLSVHALGDGSVRRALDAFETAQKVNGRRDSRHRIEHVELVHPDDFKRFKELGVIASIQPIHEALFNPVSGDTYGERVGVENWYRSFAWQTLRKAGARLVFGSDWPVAPVNPLLGIHNAMTRKLWAQILPDQRQSLGDALQSFTLDGAYTEFMEGEKGQLRSGMLADMVLLSADLGSIPPEEIKNIHPVLTMCGGTITHETGV